MVRWCWLKASLDNDSERNIPIYWIWYCIHKVMGLQKVRPRMEINRYLLDQENQHADIYRYIQWSRISDPLQIFRYLKCHIRHNDVWNRLTDFVPDCLDNLFHFVHCWKSPNHLFLSATANIWWVDDKKRFKHIKRGRSILSVLWILAIK